jgi:hypothetical protein
LDDDDGDVVFTFFVKDGALGEIKVDWAALLPLGKIDVEDSPAGVRIIFCCNPSPNAWGLTPIRYCNWPPGFLSISSGLFHGLFLNYRNQRARFSDLAVTPIATAILAGKR